MFKSGNADAAPRFFRARGDITANSTGEFLRFELKKRLSDGFDDAAPVTDLRLTEETRGRVPGAVAAIDQPTPIGGEMTRPPQCVFPSRSNDKKVFPFVRISGSSTLNLKYQAEGIHKVCVTN